MGLSRRSFLAALAIAAIGIESKGKPLSQHGNRGALPRDRFDMPHLEDYVGLPAVPPGPVDRASRVKSWPMYLNDKIGDCTVAAMAHALGAMSVYAGYPEVLFSDAVIQQAYSAVSGYDPATGANDNGATLASVCQYMTSTGTKDTTGKVHKLAGWAEIKNFRDYATIRSALYTFGTVYVAYNLPKSAEDQFDSNQPWTPVAGSPNDGGHCIVIQADTLGMDEYEPVTWGDLIRMNRAFHWDYCTEAVALISDDWVRANGTTVNGESISQLLADSRDYS